MSATRSTERLIAEPEPTPRIGRSEITRAAILDAAFEFLWSRPFREMSVNTLMAQTSMSRPAFYQYFDDIYDLMDTLLKTLEAEILEMVMPWFSEDGDPVALLYSSLAEQARVLYRRGPFLKAVSDAAGSDARVESAWQEFLRGFDDAVSERIAADQALGLIKPFEPRPVAIGLVRLDAYMFIQAFGQKPRSRPGPVLDANTRVWISTLYGERWADSHKSTLVRKQTTDSAGPG
jgi:AcrR family transcriptional regulator